MQGFFETIVMQIAYWIFALSSLKLCSGSLALTAIVPETSINLMQKLKFSGEKAHELSMLITSIIGFIAYKVI